MKTNIGRLIFSIVLLAALFGASPAEGQTMAISYQIITPDGVTYTFPGTGYSISPGIPDGFGFPPISHDTQTVYHQPGAVLKDIAIQPRVITLSAVAYSTDQETLHAARASLRAAVRWNRNKDLVPSKLRYSAGGHTVDLYVFYLSDVQGRVGSTDNLELVGIRLIAYDPLFYSSTQTTQALTLQKTLAVSYIIGQITGTWSAMGNNGTNTVSAIAISDDGDTVYVGGTFLNWAGIANADYIAKYTVSTATWAALGTGTDGTVNAIAIGSRGEVYVGGSFTLAGGIAGTVRIARYENGVWYPLGSGAANNSVFCLAIDGNNNLYAGGSFTQMGGIASTAYIAKWNGTAWSALGTGVTGGTIVHALAVSATDLYAGGEFTQMGGVASTTKIARWNLAAATWYAMGAGVSAGNYVFALAVGLGGKVYAGGSFTGMDSIANTAYIAVWNGAAWSALGTGMNGDVGALRVDYNGALYAGGAFTLAGGVALSDRVAKWNGSAWSQIEIDLPGSPSVNAIALWKDDRYFGFNTTGNAIVPWPTEVVTNGTYKTWPTFTITGPGTVQHIINQETLKKVVLNLQINAGEVITIDMRPGVKTITSAWLPSFEQVGFNHYTSPYVTHGRDMLRYVAMLPLSDFATWAIEPAPIAPAGSNTVHFLMTGIAPYEIGDNNNQLSGWANITGVTYSNTDAYGRMFVNIVDNGDGKYHVDLYKAAAKAAGDLVGHTGGYVGAGSEAIVADNSSGLGGTITIDAKTAADTDIVVFFATAKIAFYDAYLSADEACQ